MNDADLQRYARHILLDDIDVAGQEALLQSHALIIGAGGLGSAAALYLASAGVGRLTVVDNDTVDASNLQRQIAHTERSLGQAKTASMQQAIARINSTVQCHAVQQRATAATLRQWVSAADLVLDCTDNFATRQAINAACVHTRTPLVWAAATRFDGQIGVYVPPTPDAADRASHADSPCYACLFDPHHPPPDAHCATLGIFAPLVGIMGSMQAAEAIKLLCGIPGTLHHAMLLVDAKDMRFTPIALAPSPSCPVCGRSEKQRVCTESHGET